MRATNRFILQLIIQILIPEYVIQLKDLMYFLIILAVFLISYSIATYSMMYPNSSLNFELVKSMIKRSYWNLYGELFLEEIESKSNIIA